MGFKADNIEINAKRNVKKTVGADLIAIACNAESRKIRYLLYPLMSA